MKPIAIAIHGGAGTILRSQMTAEKEAAYLAALHEALEAGHALLRGGKPALDAVEAAVRVLEDCPLFNAGRGSVFHNGGGHEMDASIMDGTNRMAGAVAAVKNVRNPVQLARRVMTQSPHVLLIGAGAETFGKMQGLEFAPDDYFHTDFRWQQWQQALKEDSIQLDHADHKAEPGALDEKKFGTVGAVALDQYGNLAAATSTGGMTNKRWGRVGDSPVIGAGTWADNATCAVSCTGSGEYFLRAVAAYDVACLMEYGGLSLAAATRRVVMDKLPALGGDGGLIALDAQGQVELVFNTDGMYRGCVRPGAPAWAGIYEDYSAH